MFARHPKLLIAAVILTAAVTSLFTAESVDQQIETILAQPAATPSPEQAAPIVKQLEALAESAPARRLEIDAYLIPFRRTLESSAASTPTPAAVAPDGSASKAKPFLFLKAPGGKAQMVRANSATVQGNGLVIEFVDGRRGIYQKSFLVAQLPWYADAELESGGIDLVRLAARYEAFETVYPECKTALAAEAQRFHAINEKFRQAAEKREQDILDKQAKIEALEYDSDMAYTREELAQILLDADAYRKVAPAREGEITQIIAPFREHFENLLAGKTLFEGEWRTKEELTAIDKARQLERWRNSLEENAAINLDALVVPESRIVEATRPTVLFLLVLVAVGLIALFRRRFGLGAMLIIGPAAFTVYYLYLLLSGETSLDAIRGPAGADSEKIIRLLSLLAMSDPAMLAKEDRQVTLTDHDLNDFIQTRLRIIGEASKKGGVYRKDIAIQFVRNEVVLFEQVRHRGQLYRIRYDVKIEVLNNAPVVADYSVSVGSAPVIGPLKTWLWESIAPQLGKFLNDQQIFKTYTLTALTDGELHLTLRSAPPAEPKPITPPSATPSPTPTPSATPETTTPSTPPPVPEKVPPTLDTAPETPPPAEAPMSAPVEEPQPGPAPAVPTDQ